MVFIEVLLLAAIKKPKRLQIPLRESYLNCLEAGKDKEKGECLRNLASVAVQNYTIPEIDAEIRTITEPGQRMWCHEFVHYAGWELYKKEKSMYDAFSLASFECDSGMYHGITEEYINQASLSYSPKEFAEKVVPSACSGDKFKGNVPEAMKYHCYHGLGHAFMFLTDNDLKESLSFCDLLGINFDDSCYTGAFMENVLGKQVGRTPSHPSKTAYDASNPDYPCNILDDKYKEKCYIYKGVSNILVTNVDVKQSVLNCTEVDPKYQESCFWGVGTNIPGPHISSSGAAEKCAAALEVSKTSYKQCISGGMAFLIQLNLGDPQSAVEYCEVIEPEFKTFCYQAAGLNLNTWKAPGESLKDKCAEFPSSEAKASCENFNIKP